MSDKKLVVVGVLTQGKVVDKVSEVCCKLCMDKRYNIIVLYHPTNYIDDGRNKLVKQALDLGADYLMFLDSDNPPFLGKNPLDLVELDKDIIGLPTPIWKVNPSDIALGRVRGIRWNVFLEKGDEWVSPFGGEGLSEVHAVGTGCMIIARRVMESMKCPFMRTYDEDGIIQVGSDLLFCKKARQLGFSVWTNYDYPCSHFKFVDLALVVQLLDVRDVSQVLDLNSNPNTPEYWDEQWNKRGERILPFYHDIAEMCRDKIVLDYGCGRGDLLSLISKTAKYYCGTDISDVALQICRDRGLHVWREPYLLGDRKKWDIVVLTEVLEHIDDDKEFLEWLFSNNYGIKVDTVIYTVPNNFLPPSVEPEHRRVYTIDYITRITPNLKAIFQYGDYLLVVASIRDEYPVPPKVVNVV